VERDRVAALLELERENTALRAEVEHLRLTVAALRASVPPTHPSDYGHEAWTAALRDAVAAERAAVVAWLRAQRGLSGSSLVPSIANGLATSIERGEHRREGE